MKHEELIKRLEVSCLGLDPVDPLRLLVDDVVAALAQPEQEPVAWKWRVKDFCDWPNWSVSLKRPADSGHAQYPRTEGYEDIPLYAHPPQRTWVGLKEEDYVLVNQLCINPIQAAEFVDRLLKEKNT
jgi:hypothetical protein